MLSFIDFGNGSTLLIVNLYVVATQLIGNLLCVTNNNNLQVANYTTILTVLVPELALLN